jgi:hypothetical protein
MANDVKRENDENRLKIFYEMNRHCLSHHMNAITMYMSKDAPKDLMMIVRPASKEEVVKFPNFGMSGFATEEIIMSERMPCPCVIKIGDSMVIDMPPIHIAGIMWRDELPSVKEWTEYSGAPCKLCGINLRKRNKEYCCRFHEHISQNKSEMMKTFQKQGWDPMKWELGDETSTGGEAVRDDGRREWLGPQEEKPQKKGQWQIAIENT